MTFWTTDEMTNLINLVSEIKLKVVREMTSSYGNLETISGLQDVNESVNKINELIDEVIKHRPERRP